MAANILIEIPWKMRTLGSLDRFPFWIDQKRVDNILKILLFWLNSLFKNVRNNISKFPTSLNKVSLEYLSLDYLRNTINNKYLILEILNTLESLWNTCFSGAC